MKMRVLGSLVAACAWLMAATAAANPVQDRKDAAKHSEKAAELKQDMRKLWTAGHRRVAHGESNRNVVSIGSRPFSAC